MSVSGAETADEYARSRTGDGEPAIVARDLAKSYGTVQALAGPRRTP